MSSECFALALLSLEKGTSMLPPGHEQHEKVRAPTSLPVNTYTIHPYITYIINIYIPRNKFKDSIFGVTPATRRHHYGWDHFMTQGKHAPVFMRRR